MQPSQQFADIVVGQAGAGAADKNQREVQAGGLLHELRQIRPDDAVVIGLRKYDRFRALVVAVDVPYDRLAAQRFDHPDVVRPVHPVPAQRVRDQMIVVGRCDAIAGVGQPLERAQNVWIRGFQAAEALFQEGSVRSAGRPAELRLNHVRSAEPVGALRLLQQDATRVRPFGVVRIAEARGVRDPILDELRPPRRRAARRRHRNAGAANDQRPTGGDRGFQLFRRRIRHRKVRRESRRDYSALARLQRDSARETLLPLAGRTNATHSPWEGSPKRRGRMLRIRLGMRAFAHALAPALSHKGRSLERPSPDGLRGRGVHSGSAPRARNSASRSTPSRKWIVAMPRASAARMLARESSTNRSSPGATPARSNRIW